MQFETFIFPSIDFISFMNNNKRSRLFYNNRLLSIMVPVAGLEPARVAPTDFESVTSANSITPANMFKFCTYISLTHFLNGFKRENHIILKI